MALELVYRVGFGDARLPAHPISRLRGSGNCLGPHLDLACAEDERRMTPNDALVHDGCVPALLASNASQRER